MNIRDGIYGVAVGDAFGVPFEFSEAENVQVRITDSMIGNGTHNQEKGTWSDDTSMTLCLLDSITEEIDYKIIMESFLQWYKFGKYTANGECFDIGIGTRRALQRYMQGISPIKCGSTNIRNNGNGSLMRCIPIIYYCRNGIRREITHNLSSLTHGNEISLIACDMYVSFGYRLLNGMKMDMAYNEAIDETTKYWGKNEVQGIRELVNIFDIEYKDLSGSGYVITTLQAAIWCLLNTSCYKECICKCVKIGGDTDTVAAVAGGLAGIVYGKENIPKDWMRDLRNKELIENICDKWEKKFSIKRLQ